MGHGVSAHPAPTAARRDWCRLAAAARVRWGTGVPRRPQTRRRLFAQPGCRATAHLAHPHAAVCAVPERTVMRAIHSAARVPPVVLVPHPASQTPRVPARARLASIVHRRQLVAARYPVRRGHLVRPRPFRAPLVLVRALKASSASSVQSRARAALRVGLGPRLVSGRRSVRGPAEAGTRAHRVRPAAARYRATLALLATARAVRRVRLVHSVPSQPQIVPHVHRGSTATHLHSPPRLAPAPVRLGIFVRSPLSMPHRAQRGAMAASPDSLNRLAPGRVGRGSSAPLHPPQTRRCRANPVHMASARVPRPRRNARCAVRARATLPQASTRPHHAGRVPQGGTSRAPAPRPA
jgi:hypothetical protein